MSDDFCLIHGYEHMKTQFGNPIPYCEACENERALLDLAERINRSYLVTLNANGPTEKHLSGDELSQIVAALRAAGGAQPVSSVGKPNSCDPCGYPECGCQYSPASQSPVVAQTEELRLEWRDGPPPKPWSEEWFIALTTYGDRVVLRALPEEWTYDFKTADETYIKADKIKRWMQFPDSNYIAPASRPPAASTDLLNRLRSMPSSLNDALRTMGEAADFIAGKAAARKIAEEIRCQDRSMLTGGTLPQSLVDEFKKTGIDVVLYSSGEVTLYGDVKSINKAQFAFIDAAKINDLDALKVRQ